MDAYNELENFAIDYFGIQKEDLLSHNRETDKVLVRHIVWTAMRKLLRMSYPSIARAYKRDHTSIMHGVEKVKNNQDLRDKLRLFLINYKDYSGFMFDVDNLVDNLGTIEEKMLITQHKPEVVRKLPPSPPHVINEDRNMVNDLIPEPVKRN